MTFLPDFVTVVLDTVVSSFGPAIADPLLDVEGVCFPDFIELAALPVADCWILLASRRGAISSTSQLHYLGSVTQILDRT